MTTTVNDEVLPAFADLISAREAARIFTRAEARTTELQTVIARLKISGELGVKIVNDLLTAIPEMTPPTRMLVVNLAAYLLLTNAPKAHELLVKGLSYWLNYHDTVIRERALAILVALGERAAAAQDFALGCIRNADPQIRLGGAHLLASIGAACSRSFVRQIKASLERYPADKEFAACLQPTLEFLSSGR